MPKKLGYASTPICLMKEKDCAKNVTTNLGGQKKLGSASTPKCLTQQMECAINVFKNKSTNKINNWKVTVILI